MNAKTPQKTKRFRADTALSESERRRLLEGGYREVGFGPDGTPTVARGDEPWTLTLKPRKHYSTGRLRRLRLLRRSGGAATPNAYAEAK